MRRLLPKISLLLPIILLAACSQAPEEEVTVAEATVDFDILLTLPAQPIAFHEEVRPVLEKRCVVCHGCYDAPCQLKLSSHEGVVRGASKDRVYDGSRIKAVPPTRLFVDAQTTEEWRELGFYPVVAEGAPSADSQAAADSPVRRLDDSVMYRMLRLKQRHPQQRVGMLPPSVDVGLNREQSCPKLDEFDQYKKEHSGGGMPFALPNLSDHDYRTLVQWIAQGSEAPPRAEPSAEALPQLAIWEDFLNGGSLKQQLVSRYLYEHLFQGRLHFAGTDDREFYRLVRSQTPSGTAIRELKSVRPYDPPIAEGGDGKADGAPAPFYYRLRLYSPSIVAKDHVVYELSPQRLVRYRELFIDADYQVTELPGYELEVATNPFKAYAAIPPGSRYRFLLDDARFFIEGFIKGPVCRGQIALNVIEDQFWVTFFSPEVDIAVNNPEFLEQMADYLQLPTAEGDKLALFKVWGDYSERQRKYMRAREAFFKRIHSVDLDHAMSAIWDGDGDNPNAALTVFRHLDSASVAFGLVGAEPETAWVLDYASLERIHYLLVAGFNIYGNLGHQLNTRLYMDFLRMEGEDNYLTFLPASDRHKIREGWYQGIREGMEHFSGEMDWLSTEMVIGYQTDDPQHELFGHIKNHLGTLAKGDGVFVRCVEGVCERPQASPAQQRVDAALVRVAKVAGDQLLVFPDVSFLRVRTGDGEPDLAYTLIRNKGYKHVSSMFASEKVEDMADLAGDTLTVVPWLEGSYPNFFFVVDLEDIEGFADHYIAVDGRKEYERFVGLYGLRRTNVAFWTHADWFQDEYRREQPVLAGLFDFNRYQNR